MTTPVEKRLSLHFLRVLEEAAIKATPGPWRSPVRDEEPHIKMYGQVVADWKHRHQGETEDDREAYGGALVCESVAPKNARFIALFDPSVALMLLEFVLRARYAEFTADEARVVRTWRVDLGCSESRVAELVFKAWGYGNGHALDGHDYCVKAAELLGENANEPPWTLEGPDGQ